MDLLYSMAHTVIVAISESVSLRESDGLVTDLDTTSDSKDEAILSPFFHLTRQKILVWICIDRSN